MADENSSAGGAANSGAWMRCSALLITGALLSLAGNITFLLASGFKKDDTSSLVLHICWALLFISGGAACAKAEQWKSSSLFQTGFSILGCLAVVGCIFTIILAYVGITLFQGSAFGASPFASAFWLAQGMSLAGYALVFMAIARVMGLLKRQ